LRLLNSKGVKYLVVGGYAVAFHGHPRATGDLDVWISAAPENLVRVREALEDFGFSPELVAAAPLELPGQVIRIGRPPLRIELLTGVSGVEFDACHQRRQIHIAGEVEVAMISLADLLANKRATGRAKDIADIEELS